MIHWLIFGDVYVNVVEVMFYSIAMF